MKRKHKDLMVPGNIELEIDEQLALEDQANLDASGFQLVTNRKKSQGKSKSSSSVGKKSYSTRSKGVPIKLFR